ncbi:MAG: pirin family protein [Rhodospirillaceae bacterium]|nr:pirin family protein [Rhodospirillaceae bacterium]
MNIANRTPATGVHVPPAEAADIRAPRLVVRGRPTSDGAGVRLNRVIGGQALSDLDPFLMLDEFKSEQGADYIAGFPDHPHRGFETVTYMLAGRMRHGDNQGNTGLLRPGSVQWMTAGRGIVHSEMPEQEDGLMWGFQLWVNLPAKDKMTAPRYQDIEPEAIPVVATAEGAIVRVIAGKVGDAAGPVSAVATEPTYLDVAVPAGKRFDHALPPGHAAFIYVFDGDLTVGAGEAAQLVRRGELAALGPGNRAVLSAGERAGRAILVAGRPLREPIAKYGPFVMNSDREIIQAIEDYQRGRF